MLQATPMKMVCLVNDYSQAKYIPRLRRIIKDHGIYETSETQQDTFKLMACLDSSAIHPVTASFARWAAISGMRLGDQTEVNGGVERGTCYSWEQERNVLGRDESTMGINGFNLDTHDR